MGEVKLHPVFQKNRLVFLIGILLVSGFLGTSLVSYFVFKASTKKDIVSKQLPLTSDNIYSEIQKDLLTPVIVSTVMGTNTFLRDWVLAGEGDIEKIKNYLKEMKDKYDAITAFFVSDKTRAYYHYNGILKHIREEEPRDKWYFRVKAMKEDFEANIDPDLANKDLMTIFINYKVFDYEGNFIGATGMGLSVNSASTLIANYQKRYNRQVYFVGRDGAVILSGAKSLAPGMNILDQPFLNAIARDILSSDSGSFEYRNNGKTIFLNTRFISQLGWYVFVEQIENSAAQLPKTLFLNLAICFVIMAVILFAVTYNIRAYQNRIEKNNLDLSQANEDLRKAKSEAETASRIKGEFLATMSHEIRTPINGVLGMAELLLETNLSKDQQQNVKTISRSAESLLFLVNDILDFSKVEAGKIEIEEADFSLHKFIEDICAPFKKMCHKKGISFHNQILQEVPDRVRSDPHRLRQILANLLSNAVKFTEKGEVALTVESAPDFPFRIQFHVKDTGIGLPPEKIEKLFEPFTQADSSTSRKFGGTGLGLSIARKLAELMGGDIQARGLPEPGSVFTLALPFKEARETMSRDPEPSSAISEDLPKEAHILLVEDDMTNQEVFLAMLRNLGLNAEVAENGLKALAKLKEKRYDLVFMDCNLPEMDGYSACRAFREWEKSGEGGRPTPIVALTAYAIIGDREKCMAAGMNDYLPKPVRLSELKGILLRWLKGIKENILSETEQKDGSYRDAVMAMHRDFGKEAIPIIENFRISLPRRLDSIRKALADKSAKNLAMAAHALRGASLNFGFERLGKIAEELENLGEVGQWGGVEDLLAALEIEASRANEVLGEEIGKV